MECGSTKSLGPVRAYVNLYMKDYRVPDDALDAMLAVTGITISGVRESLVVNLISEA